MLLLLLLLLLLLELLLLTMMLMLLLLLLSHSRFVQFLKLFDERLDLLPDMVLLLLYRDCLPAHIGENVSSDASSLLDKRIILAVRKRRDFPIAVVTEESDAEKDLDSNVSEHDPSDQAI